MRDDDEVTTENPRDVAKRNYLKALRKRKDRLQSERMWWKANTPPGDEHAKGMIRRFELMIQETDEWISSHEHDAFLVPAGYEIGTPAESEPESTLRRAAQQMDWQQVVLNGGPPCFHIDEGDGHFCGRAEMWDGHRQDVPTPGVDHPFVSLEKLLFGK